MVVFFGGKIVFSSLSATIVLLLALHTFNQLSFNKVVSVGVMVKQINQTP